MKREQTSNFDELARNFLIAIGLIIFLWLMAEKGGAAMLSLFAVLVIALAVAILILNIFMPRFTLFRRSPRARLNELKSLFQDGLITEAEYTHKRDQIISDL